MITPKDVTITCHTMPIILEWCHYSASLKSTLLGEDHNTVCHGNLPVPVMLTTLMAPFTGSLCWDVATDSCRYCCAQRLTASSRGMGCLQSPAIRVRVAAAAAVAAAEAAAGCASAWLLLGGHVLLPGSLLSLGLLLLGRPLALDTLSDGRPHAAGVTSSCTSRAAAASSTTSAEPTTLTAIAMQHSWHSCSACTSQERRSYSTKVAQEHTLHLAELNCYTAQ